MTKNKPKEKDLGKSLIRARFPHRRITKDSETQLESVLKDSTVNPNSITEMKDLDEFVYRAELSGADFTAERVHTTKILTAPFVPGSVLRVDEQQRLLQEYRTKRNKLRIPRRPQWNSQMTAADLDLQEREAFLQWRRELASLMELEGSNIEFTPFEKNIEIWRQLWRVADKSSLLVQIVDARNPLLYYCEDLVEYCRELNQTKRCILLVNKADLISERQRKKWAEYFEENGIEFVFYSALTSTTQQSNSEVIDNSTEELVQTEIAIDSTQPATVNDTTRIYSSTELIDYLVEKCPVTFNSTQDKSHPNCPLKCIGLVGYPNVGKSSTINSIFGAKKVAVAATPGKTKHFQTLWLNDQVLLCDCPGLVFPNFTSSKAELVVNGILPIDQVKDYISPAALVAQRISRQFLESIYGIFICKPAEGTPSDAPPSGSELLSAYAIMRGFRTGVYGAPDESRAARLILKDYVSGKLLYCHAPPTYLDEREFNAENFESFIAERATCGKLQSKLQFQQSANVKEYGNSTLSFDKTFFSTPQMGAFVKGRGKIGNSYLTNPLARSDLNDSSSSTSKLAITVKDLPKKHFNSRRK